jgi:hypothetical protein
MIVCIICSSTSPPPCSILIGEANYRRGDPCLFHGKLVQFGGGGGRLKADCCSLPTNYNIYVLRLYRPNSYGRYMGAKEPVPQRDFDSCFHAPECTKLWTFGCRLFWPSSKSNSFEVGAYPPPVPRLPSNKS